MSIFKRGWLRPFKNQYPALKEQANKIDPADYPPSPIVLVNEHILAFKGNRVVLRNAFIIPWFLAIVVLGVMWANEFIEGWGKTEASLSATIQRQKKYMVKMFSRFQKTPIFNIC